VTGTSGQKSKVGRSIALSVFVALLLAVTCLTDAQQPGKIFHIGFLDASNAFGSTVLLETFRQELRKLGWIEGKNITI